MNITSTFSGKSKNPCDICITGGLGLNPRYLQGTPINVRFDYYLGGTKWWRDYEDRESLGTQKRPQELTHGQENFGDSVKGWRESKAESCNRKGWDAESEEGQNQWAEFESKQVQDSESNKHLYNTQGTVSSLHEPTYFTQHPHPVDRWLSSSWKWRNWGTEQLSGLSRVTQSVSNRAKIWTQAGWLQSPTLLVTLKQQARPETWTWTFYSTLTSKLLLKVPEAIV